LGGKMTDIIIKIDKLFLERIIAWALIILSIIGSITFIIAFYELTFQDSHYCNIAMSSHLELGVMEDVECYANNNAFEINFGHNLDCTCFYEGDYGYFKGLKSFSFKTK